MPRKTRIDAHGALHHIIARGIERRNAFSRWEIYSHVASDIFTIYRGSVSISFRKGYEG